MQWSLSSQRTFLLDPNLGRYTNHAVTPAGNAEGPGPASYEPRCPKKSGQSDRTAVTYRPVKGLTEREKTLSNGMVVTRIIVAGPGSYATEVPPIGRATSPSVRQAPFGSAHPRCLNMIAPSSVTSKEYSERAGLPAPGHYQDRLPGISSTPPQSARESARTRSPPTARRKAAVPRTPRSTMRLPTTSDVTSPSSTLSPPSACRTATNPHGSPRTVPRREPSPVAQQGAAPGGGTFSTLPRYFNLTDVNSRVSLERDSQFRNPTFGQYHPNDAIVSKSALSPLCGRFSRSPRRVMIGSMVANSGSLPGPGSYNVR